MEKLADIGVFGGSGFYQFLEDIKEVKVDTPYGMPSDSLFIGKIGNHRVAFMPRHGRTHSILPHMINFRANVWAMKHVGCTRVISPCAAGSLQKHVEPGHFVICDQFVDWTDGRKSTFFEGPTCYHPSPAETYCPELRELAIKTAKDLGITVHETGTVVVINGPRFSTKAESKFFTSLSAIREVSSAYLSLSIFLPEILIPACASSSLEFHMMYSAYKLNKQGDNIQCIPFPILNQFIVPCPVLTAAS